MNKIALKIIFFGLLFQQYAFSQAIVGDTTTQPSIAFEVNSNDGGFLMTRVALTARNVQAPVVGTPLTGTIVYNTNTAGVSPFNVVPGFYWWDASQNVWELLSKIKPRDIVKYRNGTTNINLNDEGTSMDIFHTLEFNENTALYEKIDNTTLRITDTGLFKMTLNLDLDGASDRDMAGLTFVVPGLTEVVLLPSIERSGSTSEQIPKTVVIYVAVPQGGIDFRILGNPINPGAINFAAVGTSSIVLERVK